MTLNKHENHFADWLRAREPLLASPQELLTLTEISQDFENIKRAWQTAIAQDDSETALLVARVMIHYFLARSEFAQGESFFALAVPEPSHATEDLADLVLAAGLLGLGYMYRHLALDKIAPTLSRSAGILKVQRQFHEAAIAQLGMVWAIPTADAEPLLEAVIQTFEQTHDVRNNILALLDLSSLRSMNNLQGALSTIQEAINLARQAGAPYLLFYTLTYAASFYIQDKNYSVAQTLLEEAGRLIESVGSDTLRAHYLSTLGTLKSALGEHEQALQYISQSVALFESLGSPKLATYGYLEVSRECYSLGQFEPAKHWALKALNDSHTVDQAEAANRAAFPALELGEYVEAEGYFRKAFFATMTDEDKVLTTTEALLGLGMAYFKVGRFERSVQLLTFVQNSPTASQLQAYSNVAAILAKARTKLSEKVFDAAQEVGKVWTFADFHTLLEAIPRIST